MMRTRLRRVDAPLCRAALVFVTAAGAGLVARPAVGEAPSAKDILAATGVRGGLVVHLGCGDGKLTAALRANESYLVHGLDAGPANVAKAREHIRSLGLYGPVSVDGFDGRRLPYVDNLVNLLVADDLGDVPTAEALRVLAPEGVAYVRRGAAWTKTVKPRPKEIDEWTHYMHDPSNNAVAHDTVVGPPRRLQWVGSPRYGRHHDRMSSVSAVVAAGGRVFYICDEASRASILIAPKWSLIARDAFNGTVLWKRGIETWHSHLLGLKSGPALLPRRLVAIGERVYVTLGLDAPLTALDAATGETVRTYEGTEAAREVLASDGVLFVVVGAGGEAPGETAAPAKAPKKPKAWWDEGPKRILALRADTGEVLWSADRWVVPLTLAADRQGVYFCDGERIACLNRRTGQQVWRSEPVPRCDSLPSHFAPTLLVYENVVLFAGGETAGKKNRSWYTEGEDTVTALSAGTGKLLWKAYHPPSGYASPEDLFVAGGAVWMPESTSGRAVGVVTGLDPQTGEVKGQFPPDVQTYWFHHRCHRGKATENYLLTSRAGIEFIDFRNKRVIPNHWVRGACLYGVMPCNGLIYAPQHPCACYLESKLWGFNAIAPAGQGPRVPEAPAEEPRLEKGPAYGQEVPQSAIRNSQSATGNPQSAIRDPQSATGNPQSAIRNSQSATGNPQSAIRDPQSATGNPQSAIRNSQSEDWPTYRHDAARSGRASTQVSSSLQPAWQADVGGRLTSPVIADGRAFVASIDSHAVHALDAATGRACWQRVVGGRVDSPPTVFQGRVLFGCADGWVYCLRASDGELAWRFRAAPMDQRLTAFEQVESVWPVPGSVLVREGVAYCVAGRSMFLDGGLRLCRLDARTGRLLSETVLDDRDQAAGKGLQDYVSWLNMPPALPDVLSSDGRLVYMRSQAFNLDGTRLPLEAMPHGQDADHGAPPATQRGDRTHLFSPTGFLDDSWWHRTYWMYGSTFVSGWCGYFLAGKAVPAGRILAIDDATVYGFGRKPQFYRWTTPLEYQLFAADKRPAPPASAAGKARKGQGPSTAVQYHWTQDVPLLARGMVLAGKTLFLAGPPDLADETALFRKIQDPQAQSDLADQAAAMDGRKGALLWAVATEDGRKLAENKLDAPPVFDGLAAANGRLYVVTTAGKVLCFSGR